MAMRWRTRIVGMIVIALPALEDGVADAEQAGAVALEVEAEGPVEQALGVIAGDGGVLEIEFELAVNVGQIDAVEHAAFFFHLLEQRRSRDRRVEHELVEVRSVRDGVLDLLVSMFSSVWCSRPTMVEPSSLMPCSRSSAANA